MTKEKIYFRYAERKDVGLILEFIKGLARYEKMTDKLTATEPVLEEWVFDRKKAEVIFAVNDQKEIGFALFYHNFSALSGRAGIYLEDLYVLPEYRGLGAGKGLIKKLTEISAERGCDCVEWCCLNWNQPSIDFYLSLGARPLDDRTTYHLDGGIVIS